MFCRNNAKQMWGVLRRAGIGLLVAGLLSASAYAQLATPAEKAEARAAAAQALQNNPDLEYDPGAILVKFRPDVMPELRPVVHALVNGRVLEEFHLVPGLELLAVSGSVEQALEELQNHPLIEYAELNYVIHGASAPRTEPDDTYFQQDLLWGLDNWGQLIDGDPGVPDADIDAPEAWYIYYFTGFTGDPDFEIGHLDTGIQMDHPDLAANLWTNPGEIPGNGIDDDGNGYIDDVHGWDFVNNDNDPMDDNGHGTHTAGILGAVGNNTIGVAGVCWNCRICPLKMLDANISGTIANAILAVQYCTTMGFRVSNNSWYGPGFSQSLYNAINASKSVGHIAVCAIGGDSNQDADIYPQYPAAFDLDNVISVTATTNDDVKVSYSNYGATSVDLGAPGEKIYSTFNNGGYARNGGTSQATPYVTGVVALVYGQNPTSTYSEVRNQVINTARPVSALVGKTVTGGVVNAYRALSGDVEGAPPAAPTNCTATSPAKGQARVSWTDNSSNESGFGVQRQTRVGSTWTNTFAWTVGAHLGTGTVTANDTPGKGTFRYRVVAYNDAACSAWTNWAQVTVR
jgi:hypothetical protein